MQLHMVSLSEPVQVTACEVSTPFSETPSDLNLLENFKISSNFKSFLFPPSVSPPLPSAISTHAWKTEKQNHKSSPLHFIWIKSRWWIASSKGSLSSVRSNSADTFGSKAPLTHCSWDTWTRLIKASEIWKTASGLWWNCRWSSTLEDIRSDRMALRYSTRKPGMWQHGSWDGIQ